MSLVYRSKNINLKNYSSKGTVTLVRRHVGRFLHGLYPFWKVGSHSPIEIRFWVRLQFSQLVTCDPRSCCRIMPWSLLWYDLGFLRWIFICVTSVSGFTLVWHMSHFQCFWEFHAVTLIHIREIFIHDWRASSNLTPIAHYSLKGFDLLALDP